jgi:hypothetical protein
MYENSETELFKEFVEESAIYEIDFKIYDKNKKVIIFKTACQH